MYLDVTNRTARSYVHFLVCLKSSESRRHYPRQFKMFLDFQKLQGTIEEQAREFLTKARQNPQWAQDNLMRFMAFQNERARRKEIAESTISNYYKATKLFCEMNDLSLSWKTIRCGLPRGTKAANDRHYSKISSVSSAVKLTALI